MALGVTKTPKDLLQAEDTIGRYSIYSFIPAVIVSIFLLPITLVTFFVSIKLGFFFLITSALILLSVFFVSIRKVDRTNYLLGKGTYMNVIVLFFLEKRTHSMQVDIEED